MLSDGSLYCFLLRSMQSSLIYSWALCYNLTPWKLNHSAVNQKCTNKLTLMSTTFITPMHRDFLPRSNGICTRRPLVLQLYSIIAAELNEGDSSRSVLSRQWNVIAEGKMCCCWRWYTTLYFVPSLTLHLNPLHNQSIRGEEWGEFLHLPNKRFYDFADIRREIEKETERMTGQLTFTQNLLLLVTTPWHLLSQAIYSREQIVFIQRC